MAYFKYKEYIIVSSKKLFKIKRCVQCSGNILPAELVG